MILCGTAFAFGIDVSPCISRGYGGNRSPFLLFCYHFATILSKNRGFQPKGSFWISILHQVGLDVEGNGGGGMSKLGLDVFDVFPVLNAEAGIGMP